MFGTLPACGFHIRHAKNVTLRDIDVRFMKEELRPPFVLQDGAHPGHSLFQPPRCVGLIIRNTEGGPAGEPSKYGCE